MSPWHWLAHVLAFDSTNDSYYAAESASLGILVPPLLTVAGAYAVWRWHHQCHVGRCFRAARFEADGHKICHRHAGKHKKLTLDHLAHFHRTGSIPKPPSTSIKE